jgi:hypothetical protein
LVYLLVFIELVMQFSMHWMVNMKMKYDRKQDLTAHSLSAEEYSAGYT